MYEGESFDQCIGSREGEGTVINIEEFIKAKGNKATADKTVSWEQVASMTDPRCMFAATVVDKRFVYAFGGLIGTKDKVQS